jgi:prepilin-type N-terminal cleavage/methylation domain-containing protein
MSPFRATSRRGLTLLELLIAITITSITGLAVAVVTTSVARGMTSMNVMRSALQRAHAAHARLAAYIDPALCVLTHDPDNGFAVWLHDDRPGGRVNLSELRVFWFNTDGSGELTVEWVEFPEEWDEDAVMLYDLELSAVDDYFTVMETQRALGYTQTAVLADGLAELNLAGNGIDLEASQRVRMTLDVTVEEDRSEQLLLVFGLPDHQQPL